MTSWAEANRDYLQYRVFVTKTRVSREVTRLQRIAKIAKGCGHSNEQAAKDFGELIGFVLGDALRAYDRHQGALRNLKEIG